MKIHTEATGRKTRKPSLLRYFWFELKWAVWTSRDWVRLFFRDRQLAMNQLREGLKSEQFRERTRGWNRATTFAYGKLRLSAPFMVGFATALYCGFTQHTILASLAYGVSAGVITHVALLAFPFAVLASVPVLAFFFIRALLPANLPEPPEKEQQVVENRELEPRSPEDLLEKENQVTGNGAMLAQFDGSDRPLVVRILESDGSVVVSDPADLKKVSRWIEVVREERQAMAAREKEIERLHDLATYIDHRALFELGLLDRASFDPVPPEFELTSEDARLAAIEQRNKDRELEFAALESHRRGALKDTYLDPTDTEPKPTGDQIRFINPRGLGYVIGTPGELRAMPAPSLSSPAIRMMVTTYAEATGDTKMMKDLMLIRKTAPDERTVFLQAGVPITIDLRHYEDLILTGEIKDTVAQELARYYATVKQAAKETTDYLSHLQPVARLVKLALDEAHKRLRQETAKAQAAEAAAKKTEESAYSHLLNKKPEFTNDVLWQRRDQLKKLIQESVPRKPLDR